MEIKTKEEAKAHIEDVKGFMTFYDAERIMNGETTPEDVLNEEKLAELREEAAIIDSERGEHN